MTAKPHGAESRAFRRTEPVSTPEGTNFGKSVARKSPQRLHFRGSRTTTPERTGIDAE